MQKYTPVVVFIDPVSYNKDCKNYSDKCVHVQMKTTAVNTKSIFQIRLLLNSMYTHNVRLFLVRQRACSWLVLLQDILQASDRDCTLQCNYVLNIQTECSIFSHYLTHTD